MKARLGLFTAWSFSRRYGSPPLDTCTLAVGLSLACGLMLPLRRSAWWEHAERSRLQVLLGALLEGIPPSVAGEAASFEGEGDTTAQL